MKYVGFDCMEIDVLIDNNVGKFDLFYVCIKKIKNFSEFQLVKTDEKNCYV